MLARGITPAIQIWHNLLTKTLLILCAVNIGIDFGVITLILEDREMMEHLGFVLGGATQEMLVIQFDKMIWIVLFKEAGTIEVALGDKAHKFPHAQVAIPEQGFGAAKPLIQIGRAHV